MNIPEPIDIYLLDRIFSQGKKIVDTFNNYWFRSPSLSTMNWTPKAKTPKTFPEPIVFSRYLAPFFAAKEPEYYQIIRREQKKDTIIKTIYQAITNNDKELYNLIPPYFKRESVLSTSNKIYCTIIQKFSSHKIYQITSLCIIITAR